MYDIVVIGARPSGCVAAKMLAEKGYKVLLVEKCKMPRYKSCSGILDYFAPIALPVHAISTFDSRISIICSQNNTTSLFGLTVIHQTKQIVSMAHFSAGDSLYH